MPRRLVTGRVPRQLLTSHQVAEKTPPSEGRRGRWSLRRRGYLPRRRSEAVALAPQSGERDGARGLLLGTPTAWPAIILRRLVRPRSYAVVIPVEDSSPARSAPAWSHTIRTGSSRQERASPFRALVPPPGSISIRFGPPSHLQHE